MRKIENKGKYIDKRWIIWTYDGGSFFGEGIYKLFSCLTKIKPGEPVYLDNRGIVRPIRKWHMKYPRKYQPVGFMASNSKQLELNRRLREHDEQPQSAS